MLKMQSSFTTATQVVVNDIHPSCSQKCLVLCDKLYGHPAYPVGHPTCAAHVYMYIILMTILWYCSVLLFSLPISGSFFFVLCHVFSEYLLSDYMTH